MKDSFLLFLRIANSIGSSRQAARLRKYLHLSFSTAHLLNSRNCLVQLLHRQLQFRDHSYSLSPLQITVFARGVDLEAVKRMRPHCFAGKKQLSRHEVILAIAGLNFGTPSEVTTVEDETLVMAHDDEMSDERCDERSLQIWKFIRQLIDFIPILIVLFKQS